MQNIPEQFNRADEHEYKEKIVGLARNIVEMMEGIDGVSVTPGKTREVIGFLTSKSILERTGEFIGFFVFEYEVGEQLVELRASDKFSATWGRLLRYQLVTDTYKQELLGNIKITEQSNLNSARLTESGLHVVKEIIKRIIEDEDGMVEQGAFWNTLIPKQGKYVLKTEREEARHSTVLEELGQYATVKEKFGEKFLLEQIVLEMEGSDKVAMLQERLDLSKVIQLSVGEIDKLLSENNETLDKIIKQTKNKSLLNEFINKMENLIECCGLYLDVLGENVYLKVDDSLEIKEIKIADYGCFKYEDSDDYSHIESVKKFINDLKPLVAC